MSGITGLSTSFNMPNYHGELLGLTPELTPFLTAIGGVGGGKQTTDVDFTWQDYDLRKPGIRARLEGADAPTAEARVRANRANTTQIFHEAVSTSYTKQAAISSYAAVGNGDNPVTDEQGWQIEQSLKQMKRDLSYSFWHAKYSRPADNATARQTRGLLDAISTNKKIAGGEALVTAASAAADTITVTHSLAVDDKVVFTDVGASTTIEPHTAYWVKSVSTTASFKISEEKGGAAIAVGTATVAFYAAKAANVVTPDLIGDLCQKVYQSGGIAESGTATLWVAPGQKRQISKAYTTAGSSTAGLLAGTRNVGGISMDTVLTDFGTLNIAVDNDVPDDALVVTSLEQLNPVFLNIPEKGVLFYEELAKTGSSIKGQIYGEIGLAYGNERAHGVLRGLFPTNA